MKAFVLITLLLSSLGFAGGTSSGGGNSVVCFDSAGKIFSAEVLDLYEARNLLGLNIPKSDAPVMEQAEKAIESFATDDILGRQWEKVFKKTVVDMDLVKRILPPGNGLRPIDDSNHIVIPKNCKIYQLASYESNQKLFIDGDIWEVLDNQNKAALLLHEAFYLILRTFGETNSIRVREFVGHAFAGTQLKPPYDLAFNAKDLKTCSTSSDDLTIPRFSFQRYLDEDGKYVFRFGIYDGFLLFTEASVKAGPLTSLHNDILTTYSNISTIMSQGLNTNLAIWLKILPNGQEENYIAVMTSYQSFKDRIPFTCKPF